MKKLNPIGENYGKLKIISEHSKTRNGHYRYTCQCECGNIVNILLTHLRQGNTLSCGCDKSFGKEHPLWKGIGELSGNFWNHHIIRSANGEKRKSIEITIDKEYCWNLFLKQNRKCALSGIELKFPKKYNSKDWTASLDRIDSGEGYIDGNVQWVHKDINIMKNKFNNEYFINICKLISKNYDKDKN